MIAYLRENSDAPEYQQWRERRMTREERQGDDEENNITVEGLYTDGSDADCADESEELIVIYPPAPLVKLHQHDRLEKEERDITKEAIEFICPSTIALSARDKRLANRNFKSFVKDQQKCIDFFSHIVEVEVANNNDCGVQNESNKYCGPSPCY